MTDAFYPLPSSKKSGERKQDQVVEIDLTLKRGDYLTETGYDAQIVRKYFFPVKGMEVVQGQNVVR